MYAPFLDSSPQFATELFICAVLRADALNAKIKDFRAQLRGVIDKKFFFRPVRIFG